MSGRLDLLDGGTFFLSSENGDVDHTSPNGFFHEDVRHLSRWIVRVDGARLAPLTSSTVDYYSARVAAVPEAGAGAVHFPLSVTRDRFLAGGVHEDLTVENHGLERRDVELEIRFGCDFADIAEAQGEELDAAKARVRVERGNQTATLWYRREGFVRGTRIAFDQPCEIRRDRAVFRLGLDPKERWHTCVDITPIVGEGERPPLLRCGSFGRPLPEMPIDFESWMSGAPRLEADWRELEEAYEASLSQLAELRIRPTEGLDFALPAGGLPWFMTLFRRDTLIAAYEALPFRPELAQTALEALARLQASEDDPFADAEPGKILHELRRGERAALGELPGVYYGSHDATLLFLTVLDEYEAWTGDAEHAMMLETSARAAIEWLERYADPDGDGYLEYRRRSPTGLDNQVWKDSFDSIRFADGRLATPPIAACEVQGYAYDARRRAARLARAVWKDDALAERLERDAESLKERFDRDFWLEERGYYAAALDGRKRPVDSTTSNAGHLLWSGIVPEARAAAVVERLMADDVFTGWGLRTMSAKDAAYGPLEYHNGTVWPHDTAIAAEGMRRYGFREEATILARAVVETSAAFGHRLPEVFAGFQRDAANLPVAYPHANRPQAFAVGAPLLALRTLLALDVVDGRLRYHVSVPAEVGDVRLAGFSVRGAAQDVFAAAAAPSEADDRHERRLAH